MWHPSITSFLLDPCQHHHLHLNWDYHTPIIVYNVSYFVGISHPLSWTPGMFVFIILQYILIYIFYRELQTCPARRLSLPCHPSSRTHSLITVASCIWILSGCGEHLCIYLFNRFGNKGQNTATKKAVYQMLASMYVTNPMGIMVLTGMYKVTHLGQDV